jgi:hypothetical protein
MVLDTSEGSTDEISAQQVPKAGGLAQPLAQLESAPREAGDVEGALAAALTAAAGAGQWGVVETLARELEARRAARAAAQPAGVIRLDDEKRRRGR